MRQPKRQVAKEDAVAMPKLFCLLRVHVAAIAHGDLTPNTAAAEGQTELPVSTAAVLLAAAAPPGG